MTTTPPPTLLRDCAATDLPQVTAIYAWHVRHGTGSFETEAPDLAEMTRRHHDVTAKGWPWLVAERDGQVLGYAYANAFRPRLAYRFAVEDSIYLAEAARRQGLGRLLLAELLARCQAAGARQMFAVIGDSANAGSIALHRSCGFQDVGVMRSAGWKFERWLDVVIMQRALGLGDQAAPQERGVAA